MTVSFAERVLHAMAEAKRVSAPFVPSRAEYEFSLSPLVTELVAMPREESLAYIRATFNHNGYEGVALAMFKERLAKQLQAA